VVAGPLTGKRQPGRATKGAGRSLTISDIDFMDKSETMIWQADYCCWFQPLTSVMNRILLRPPPSPRRRSKPSS